MSMSSIRKPIKWILPFGILMLVLMSTPVFSESSTYVITFKESENGPFRGADTFVFDPVAAGGATTSISFTMTWTDYSDFTFTGNVSSTPNHKPYVGPSVPQPGDPNNLYIGSSRVEGISGVQNVADPSGTSLTVTLTSLGDSRGNWTIDAVTPNPNGPPIETSETGFYLIRNSAHATTVPEPSAGLILLAGLVPLGVMIRRRRLGSGR